MEGLEVSDAKLSKVLEGTETKRFDPEYFQKKHLADEQHALQHAKQFTSFDALGLRVDGSAFYPGIEEFYEQGDLPFLRVADVDSVIDMEGCTKIPEELCERYSTLSRVYPGDIVFTKGGSVARIGLVTTKAAASRDLIFLDSSRLSEADRIFIYLYFQSSFFNRMLLRSSSQTAQPHLTITLVRKLPILTATSEFKMRCLELVEESFRRRRDSFQFQAQAEQTLLRALGLVHWQPPEPLTYTRRFSEALAAGRIDADYFAPRVAQLLSRLHADGLTIADVAPARHESFDPAAPTAQDNTARGIAPGAPDKESQALKGRDNRLPVELSRPVGAAPDLLPIPGALPRAVLSQAVGLSRPEAPDDAADTFQYIEISGLRSDGTATSETVPCDEAPSRASQLVRPGDIITSTVRPIRRLSAIITPDQDGHVCSSGFVVLQPKHIAPEVLLTYLRLPIICELMDLHTSASLYPAISERDLLKLPIPAISKDTTAAITQNIRAAHTARAAAHTLLEKAKRAVEVAIEEGEEAAKLILK